MIITTRELTLINMFCGQLANHVLNSVLKHAVKQERPGPLGDGYGFPSLHSQAMGYFAMFMFLHLNLRHSFTSYGSKLVIVDHIQRFALFLFLWAWAGAVCYSRVLLMYHSVEQVVAGFFVGALFAILHYLLTEPLRRFSRAESMRRALLDSTPARYWRLRDGWAIYTDGGFESAYNSWRRKWESLDTNTNTHMEGKYD